ncbi:glycoside hydrolase superfamily [Exophiala viscosa]|uniref:glycoside hydrolase superfamily n=1 Tax=Exophiala viscosa TaxID=2486360 RepID=UPI00218CD2CB|nr:glycoside hydrolase superfamily [Exophiala viscosa]
MSLSNTVELNTGWQFREIDLGKSDSWLPVPSIPSVVHMDLIHNKRIPDPSLDTNELDCQWVEEKSWRYMLEFATPSRKIGDKAVIVFEGLDTVATVKLNGNEILKSDNMFVSHRIDITTQHLDTSHNTLEIDFASAARYARGVEKDHPEHWFIAHQGESTRMGLRKAQYHWGWDWGPRLVTAGIWRPVRLETFSSRVEDVSVQYSVDEKSKDCQGIIDVHVEANAQGPDGSSVLEKQITVEKSAQVPFTLRKASLWYPFGYGEQSLYTLTCNIVHGTTIIDNVRRKVGFRKAELVQEKDSYGKSFYVRVNGIDIFAGGSCWIPADPFIPRISAQRYREVLTAMVESNQVMTRIWGGGIYEEDIFYEVCDELGILVWQDFMFACGSYPAFPDFLDSVEREARQNVRRLRHHPSVVLYAGGNENYYIQETYKLTYDYAGDKDPQSWLKSSFPSRYIFEHLLPKVLAEESPGSIYHPDSPWGDGNPILDDTVGDIHQWEVWHGVMKPYQIYGEIGGRFNSEFGMEAAPHISTINQSISDPREKHPSSWTMDFHNKAGQQQRRLASYISENFKVTNLDLNSWVYLTQLLQSEAMHYAYRSWRRQWGKPSQRQCGGALVWQLNDTWPATSWAIVDYYLVKKPSFYAMKRDLSPLSVAVMRKHNNDWTKLFPSRPDTIEYDLWVSSSKATHIENATIELRFISIRTGQEFLPTQHKTARIEANSCTTILDNTKLDCPLDRDAFVIFAKLIIDGNVVSRDYDWPQPYRYLSFEDRGLGVKLNESRNQISISATRPVKGLIFGERPGLTLSDNSIDVMPGEQYIVDVDGLQEGEALTWKYLGQAEAPTCKL